MMTIVRDNEDGAYSTHIGKADIATIANEIRRVPDEYINDEGNGITEAGLDYLAPLIVGEPYVEYENGLPKHFII